MIRLTESPVMCRVANATLNSTIAALVMSLAWVTWNVIGPPVERYIVPPVQSLSFEPVLCYDTHLVARVRLDKTEYWNGSYAEYLALNLRLTDEHGRAIRWYEYSGEWPDRQRPRTGRYSRPAGVTTFNLVLLDACGHRYVAHTEHRSPITGLKIRMLFGPYDGTAPRNITSSDEK